MTKVLLIGNGGREHVIAETLVRGGAELSAYMAKRNPGIAHLCQERIKLGNLNDFKSIGEFGHGVDFAIVGPEAPLTAGIVNALNAQNIRVVGPSIENAQLEGSKIFARKLLDQANISSNIKFKTFESMQGIKEFVSELRKENVVVKPDGLTGGKGVKVWGDHLHSEDEIYSYCQEILENRGRIVIEEKLDGEEFTYMCFVDGKHVIGSPLVQDNKRAFNGDLGPNTGGMGSYSMADHYMPFISQTDVDYARKQIELSIKAVANATGTEYIGILYGQFMKTASGIKLVEFNIRFGDPEAMNILPLMKTNFVKICEQMLDGKLTKSIEFEKKATVCKYLVPEGYPDHPKEHVVIKVDERELRSIGVKFYYASVSEEQNNIYTTSSRTFGILGMGKTIQEAEQLAERGTSCVIGPLSHRTDIGTQEIIQKRSRHMDQLLRKK
jgi:phosphoribosylamine--glycine ligase